MALLASPINAARSLLLLPTPPLALDSLPSEPPAKRAARSISPSPSLSFPHFESDNTSLLRQVLTPELFATLRHRRTPSGFTLHEVIRSGVEQQDSKVGIYAGDLESYSTFRELFDPVIQGYQASFGGTDRHACDFDGRKLLGSPDPTGRYVLSVRARVARNIVGFPFSPNVTAQQRAEVEEIVVHALRSTTLAGQYWTLPTLTDEERQALVDQHLLFNGVDRFQRSAGILRDWPHARGMYQVDAGQLLVWVNEQDHLRIIALQPGSDLTTVFHRLAEGIHVIGSALEALGFPFVFDPHRGYMGSEPSQLGTGLRASVLIRLPLLTRHPKFRAVCQGLGLGIRGTNGEHTPIVDGVVDISNRQRLGSTEVALVQLVIDGSQKLIELEQRLERQEAI